jgi:hypothetical protein
MLSVVTGITFLTNCTKQEIVQEEEQTNNYWYPTTKDIVITDIPLSQLADSIEKYNTLQEYTNYIIEGYVIMDTVKYTSLVFNPNDYVTFNDESTGIEELKSTVTGKANIKFIETDTISNTFHLGSAFNYDGQGGLNPEINEILAENPIPVDTFHWETAFIAEQFELSCDINNIETVVDISSALVTKFGIEDFSNNNGWGYTVINPNGNIGSLQNNDTIQWEYAVSSFEFQTAVEYINGQGAYIQTTLGIGSSSTIINYMLGDLPENFPNISFLYNDQTIIPSEYYQ